MPLYDFEHAKRIIKNQFSCMDVADVMGISYNRYGRCRCPLHGGDNSTAFRMYRIDENHDGGFYCYSCHAAGDVIRFVELLNGMTFPEALNWFRETFNLRFPEINEIPPEAQEKRNKDQELREKVYKAVDDLYDLYGRVMEEGKVEVIPECSRLLDTFEETMKELKK